MISISNYCPNLQPVSAIPGKATRRKQKFTSMEIKINVKDSFARTMLVNCIQFLSSTARMAGMENGLKV